jgi:ubiquinone/menaquinone biosynthesis C-methylase UbiE
MYSRFAGIYGLLLDIVPLWNQWIDRALPHLQGPRVLEVSFGTGHLMSRYAGSFQVFGIDLNPRMTRQAQSRVRANGLSAQLQIANVEALPYAADSFDCVLTTMAFSGYPDGKQALIEMRRVLRSGGRFVMVDVNFPRDRNTLGMKLASFWKSTGDLLRDVPGLFTEIGWQCSDREVGGFGSVHLYLAKKD